MAAKRQRAPKTKDEERVPAVKKPTRGKVLPPPFRDPREDESTPKDPEPEHPPGSLAAFVAEVRGILSAANCHDFSDRLPNNSDRREPCLCVSWTTGGLSGGSCWDSSDEPARFRSVAGEVPQELTGLDIILEKMNPSVSFMEYRKLVREVVQTKTYRGGSDFYGNYTDEATKFVRLSALYDAFRERGWPTP